MSRESGRIHADSRHPRTTLEEGALHRPLMSRAQVAGLAVLTAASVWALTYLPGGPSTEKIVCDEPDQPLVVPADQTPSQAIKNQVGGLDGDWSQLNQVPVKAPDGSVNPLKYYGAAGPPAGSSVPLACE